MTISKKKKNPQRELGGEKHLFQGSAIPIKHYDIKCLRTTQEVTFYGGR